MGSIKEEEEEEGARRALGSVTSGPAWGARGAGVEEGRAASGSAHKARRSSEPPNPGRRDGLLTVNMAGRMGRAWGEKAAGSLPVMGCTPAQV
jgi:hypothetical protein